MNETILVKGLDRGALLRFLLENEVTMRVDYPNGGQSLLVGFSRGTWYLHMSPLNIFLTFSDTLEIISSNSILKATVEGLIKLAKYKLDLRSNQVRILEEVINIWSGGHEFIQNITVIQNGRNSVVSEDGTLTLDPRMDDWLINK